VGFGQAAPPPPFGEAVPPFGQTAPPPFGQAAAPPGWGAGAGSGTFSPGGWVPTPTTRRAGLALPSFILGLVGVAFCFFFVPSILAIVFGFVALSAIRRESPALTGRSLAIWGIVLGFLGLAIIAGLVVADSAGLLDEDGSSSGSSPFLGDDEVMFNQLDVGQCIVLPDDISGAIRGIEVADCAESHGGEVFATGDLAPEGGREFPGLDVVLGEVEQACFDAYEPYVGVSYAESEFDVVYFYPRELSWRVDTGFVCVATDPSGDSLVGSVRDSGR
jgi:hypothetical protein